MSQRAAPHLPDYRLVTVAVVLPAEPPPAPDWHGNLADAVLESLASSGLTPEFTEVRAAIEYAPGKMPADGIVFAQRWPAGK